MKASTIVVAVLLTILGAAAASAQTSPSAGAQQPAPPPAPPFGPPITVEQAQKAAEAAMAKAKEIGVPNAVAVVSALQITARVRLDCSRLVCPDRQAMM